MTQQPKRRPTTIHACSRLTAETHPRRSISVLLKESKGLCPHRPKAIFLQDRQRHQGVRRTKGGLRMTHDEVPPTTRMVRVPTPQFMEAPSSWLSRVALRQGASLRELLHHLNLPTSGDLDFKMAKLGMAHLQNKMGDTIATQLRVCASNRISWSWKGYTNSQKRLGWRTASCVRPTGGSKCPQPPGLLHSGQTGRPHPARMTTTRRGVHR